jgi:hypothetical protein
MINQRSEMQRTSLDTMCTVNWGTPLYPLLPDFTGSLQGIQIILYLIFIFLSLSNKGKIN